MNQRFTIFTVGLFLSLSLLDSNAQTNQAHNTFPDGIYLFGVDKKKEKNARSIEVLSTDGKKLQTILTPKEGYCSGGLLSRQGDQMAYMLSRSGGNKQIVVVEADRQTSKSFEFADDTTLTAWSPDGSQLAYYQWNKEKEQFDSFVLGLNSGERTKLDLPDDYVAEDWQPIGVKKTAIYANPRNYIYRESKGDSYPTRQLDLLLPDGKTKPITKLPATDNVLSRFSPSGDRIAHYSRFLVGEKPFEIVVVCKLDGSDRKVVFEYRKFGESQGLYWFRPLGGPVWSPDGGSLATLVEIYKTTEEQQAQENMKLELVIVSLKGEPPKRISLTDMGIKWVSSLDWR